MALPTSGLITMDMVRKELDINGTVTLNDTKVRKLAGKLTGTISMIDLYGKEDFRYTLKRQAISTFFRVASGGRDVDVWWSGGYAIDVIHPTSRLLNKIKFYDSTNKLVLESGFNTPWNDGEIVVVSVANPPTRPGSTGSGWVASQSVARTSIFFGVNGREWYNTTLNYFRVAVVDTTGKEYLLDKHINYSVDCGRHVKALNATSSSGVMDIFNQETAFYNVVVPPNA